MAPEPISVNNLTQVGRTNVRDPNIPDVYVTYSADFTNPTAYAIDFTLVNQTQQFGVVRGLFCDNRGNDQEIVVSVSISNQVFSIPAYAQGYFKIDASINSSVSFTSAGGAVNRVTITLYNYDVAPNVWYSYGANNTDTPMKVYGPIAEGDDIATAPTNNPVFVGGRDPSGDMIGLSLAADGSILATISGAVTVSNLPATQGAYTDRSLALTGVSQNLMPANAARRFLLISNIAGNNIGVNLTGGTAAIGSAGTMTITPGNFLRIDNFPPNGIVTIIGTAADIVTAYEG
jgi:hypothetical protein